MEAYIWVALFRGRGISVPARFAAHAARVVKHFFLGQQVPDRVCTAYAQTKARDALIVDFYSKAVIVVMEMEV